MTNSFSTRSLRFQKWNARVKVMAHRKEFFVPVNCCPAHRFVSIRFGEDFPNGSGGPAGLEKDAWGTVDHIRDGLIVRRNHDTAVSHGCDDRGWLPLGKVPGQQKGKIASFEQTAFYFANARPHIAHNVL